MGLIASRFWSDARHYQIAALATLVIYNLGWIDFGARPLNSAPARLKQEARNLAGLTGWKESEIEARMEAAGQSTNAR